MLKIKTTKLQEMLSRAVQGASCNKLIPMTGLLTLELKDGELTITTTDKTNYLYVKEKVEGEDFYVCTSVEKLPKLIARLTCEDVALDLKDNYLEVKGNGTYQIEFQLDENGEMVKFPNPLDGLELTEIGEIDLATVKNILTNIRPALAVKANRPQYMSYYVGDSVIATDTNKISALKTKIFTDGKDRLVSAEMMNLLDTMIDDTIKIYSANDNKLVFKTEHGVVFGYTPEGVQQFNIKAITDFIEKEYPSFCKVSKAEFLQVLDRISLFVDSLEQDIIEIGFEQDGIRISSRKGNGSELIPYIENKDFAEFKGLILLDRLRTQIKAQTGDSIDIYFGIQKAIKFVDENAVFVTALGAEA